MASFSINPVGSYTNWPEQRQQDGERKKARKKPESPDETEPDEKEPPAVSEGPIGTEIDIEV